MLNHCVVVGCNNYVGKNLGFVFSAFQAIGSSRKGLDGYPAKKSYGPIVVKICFYRINSTKFPIVPDSYRIVHADVLITFSGSITTINDPLRIVVHIFLAIRVLSPIVVNINFHTYHHKSFMIVVQAFLLICLLSSKVINTHSRLFHIYHKQSFRDLRTSFLSDIRVLS